MLFFYNQVSFYKTNVTSNATKEQESDEDQAKGEEASGEQRAWGEHRAWVHMMAYQQHLHPWDTFQVT